MRRPSIRPHSNAFRRGCAVGALKSRLYGPQFTFVVPAGRVLEGTVREAGTGAPVAGMTVSVPPGSGAVTDKNGHYRLEGIAKIRQYLMNAEPPKGSAWLRTGARVDDTEGLAPLRVDLTAARGIVVTGQVRDKTTGKGVEGGIRFVPLPGNNFAGKPGYDSYKYERLISQVETDGRFRLVVMPGRGVLMVDVERNIARANGGQPLNPYKRAEFDATERQHVKISESGDGDHYFTAVDNTIESINIHNAVKYLDLAPDAGPVTCDLFVDRGQTRTVKIEDAEGKPLTGTLVAGVTASWPTTFVIPKADCTVFALDPTKPRELAFFHAERKLAGLLTVRGDEKERPVARLVPAGSVTGRMLDPDGQPIAGADVGLWSPDRSTRTLYGERTRNRPLARTDKDGRFRIEGVMPGTKFRVTVERKGRFFLIEPRAGEPRDRQVQSGETIDLGDLRAKPQN